MQLDVILLRYFHLKSFLSASIYTKKAYIIIIVLVSTIWGRLHKPYLSIYFSLELCPLLTLALNLFHHYSGFLSLILLP